MSPFDKVYVINLPGRETALEGERIFARPPRGDFLMNNMRRNGRTEFAVNLSHVKAIAHALNDGAERPLFLEDDVEFIRALPKLPDDYDIVFLGGHPREKTFSHSEGVRRVKTFSFAEAYSLSRKALLPFLDFWFDRIGQPRAMFDFILGEFAAANKGYACYPTVTRQKDGVSQVSGKMERKDAMVERGWLENI